MTAYYKYFIIVIKRVYAGGVECPGQSFITIRY